MRKLLVASAVNSLSLTELERENNPEEVARLFIDLSYDNKRSVISSYPRASGIYKSCARQLVLCFNKKIDFNKFIGAGMKVTFEIGNSFHYWIQNTPRLLGNNRRGRWRCSACHYLSVFGPPITSRCPKCNALPSAFVYDEVDIFMISPFYLTGHPDMFIERPQGNFRIMEIKSINSRDFHSLQSPLPEHIWQIHSYILACVHDSLNLGVNIDKEVGYITYISKGHESKAFPVKTFVVKKDLSVMFSIKEKLEAFRAGIDEHRVPAPISSCVSSGFSCNISKSCPVVDSCMENL